MNGITFINKLLSRSIHLAVFLTPLFFLPFTFDFYESAKQGLFIFLISVAWLLWLLKSIFIRKNLAIRKTPIDLFLSLFLGLGFISTIFAIDKLSAFWGYYGRFVGGFIEIFFLASMVYLIVSSSLKSLRLPSLLKTFLWSGFFTSAVSLLVLIGFWQKSSFLPGFVKQGLFTPVAGSFDGLSVFLAVFVVLLLSLFYFGLSAFQKKLSSLVFTRAFLIVSLILSLVLMFFINFNTAWYILLISLFLLTFFIFINHFVFAKKTGGNFFKIPFVLLLVFLFGVISLFVPFNVNKQALPGEVLLGLDDSFSVAVRHLKKDPVLGVGPGNYIYSFVQSKPASFNNSEFWQVRFDRSGSALAEMVSTHGLVGFVSYLLMLLAIFFVYAKASPYFWQKDKKHYFVPFFVLLTILIAQFFYPQNTVLLFAFWFFVALAMLALQKSPLKNAFRKRIFSFKSKPEWGALLAGLFILSVLLWIASIAFGFRYLLADGYYAKVALGRTENTNDQVKLLDKTIRLNNNIPNYWSARADAYLNQAQKIIKEEGITSQEQSEQLVKLLDGVVKSGKTATDLAGKNPIFWEALGDLYSQMSGLVDGSYLWSQESFKKAFVLDPQNPVPAVLAAKAYLAEISGDDFAKDSMQLKQAEDLLNRALRLKPDYGQAHLYLAMAREIQERSGEAVSILLDQIKENPKFLDAYFQLGRIYFNQNKLDLAITQFKKVIEINPDHANAHYSLGVIYKVKNQNSLALQHFQKVLELNPGNKDVAGKIREVQGLN